MANDINDLNNDENSDKQSQEKPNKGESFKIEVISWIKTIAGAIILAYFITTFIIVNATVPTGSMKNTIMPGDRLIALRLSYLLTEPQRYDIVVFKYPDDESFLYIKRIIGLPGDTVEIIDGRVYLNNDSEPIADEYVREKMLGSFGPYTVPENSYFMLGDNRNDSKDSRFWENNFVAKEKILGKAIFKYYPKIEWLANK